EFLHTLNKARIPALVNSDAFLERRRMHLLKFIESRLALLSQFFLPCLFLCQPLGFLSSLFFVNLRLLWLLCRLLRKSGPTPEAETHSENDQMKCLHRLLVSWIVLKCLSKHSPTSVVFRIVCRHGMTKTFLTAYSSQGVFYVEARRPRYAFSRP